MGLGNVLGDGDEVWERDMKMETKLDAPIGFVYLHLPRWLLLLSRKSMVLRPPSTRVHSTHVLWRNLSSGLNVGCFMRNELISEFNVLLRVGVSVFRGNDDGA